MLLRGFTWLVVFQLLGTVVNVLWIPQVPAPILGMLLLFVFLVFKRAEVPETIAQASGSLLRYLPLILVPPAVGVMLYTRLLGEHFLAIAAAMLLSVVIGLLFVGGGMQWLINRKQRKEAALDERT